jgi:hypothetical protein
VDAPPPEWEISPAIDPTEAVETIRTYRGVEASVVPEGLNKRLVAKVRLLELIS